MSARDEVLRRIRTALLAAPNPAGDASIVRDYRTTGERDPNALLDLLEDRLVDYKALVHRIPAGDLGPAVARALAARAARRVGLPPGLELTLPGVDIVLDLVPDHGLTVEQLDTLDGVVTACAVAIAETGTIVLDGGPAQGRRALTLVPDYHLCIVHTTQIVATVPEAITRLDPVAPQTWISGPSATSDIELERVEGVHGPRTLEVLLVTG